MYFRRLYYSSLWSSYFYNMPVLSIYNKAPMTSHTAIRINQLIYDNYLTGFNLPKNIIILLDTHFSHIFSTTLSSYMRSQESLAGQFFNCRYFSMMQEDRRMKIGNMRGQYFYLVCWMTCLARYVFKTRDCSKPVYLICNELIFQ